MRKRGDGGSYATWSDARARMQADARARARKRKWRAEGRGALERRLMCMLKLQGMSIKLAVTMLRMWIQTGRRRLGRRGSAGSARRGSGARRRRCSSCGGGERSRAASLPQPLGVPLMWHGSRELGCCDQGVSFRSSCRERYFGSLPGGEVV